MDVKKNVEQLKTMDDERVRAADHAEKLEKSGKYKAETLPLSYGPNAAPLNSSSYSYQVFCPVMIFGNNLCTILGKVVGIELIMSWCCTVLYCS